MKHHKPLISKTWPLALLALLFITSVFLRLSSFSLDPIRSAGFTPFARFNNTEVWIHNKIVFDVYENYPVTTHKFASYIGGDSANEFAPNKKESGLIVYTSFPSAHFVIPYLVFKTLGLPLSFTSLQLFGLAIQAVCVGLLYYLVLLLAHRRLIAVLAASAYIFSTATLQHHLNVYWAHQLLMPVFLTTLVVFVRQKGVFRWWQAFALGFAMSAITWTGAVATIGFALYGGYVFWRTKNRQYLFGLFLLAGMAAALALILLQVLFATGLSLPEYLQKVAHRAQARSAGTTYTSVPVLLWHLCNDLLINYGGYALIAYTTALRQRFSSFEWAVLFVASFPLLESFVLLEHDTVYGFGLLKWFIPVVIVLGIAGSHFANTKRRTAWFAAAVVAAHVVHALLFLVVYRA